MSINSSTIFFNFKDILSSALVDSTVYLTPLIYPIVSGSQTIINDPIAVQTDATGSAYFYNTVLPNIFQVDILSKKKKVTYFANIPTASNDNLPFNASTYIISASIDNGNPTDIVFDIANVISQPYAGKRVRVGPVNPFIPNVNSGSIVPGDYKEFVTDGSGGFFTALVPGQYLVECFSTPTKNIPIFTILVPANSGSLNLNQVIVPNSQNQINISIPFSNAPGQSLTIPQLYSIFQTIITSGSFLDVLSQQSVGADFAVLAGNTLYTASYANFSATASVALNSLPPVSCSWASASLSSTSASYSSRSDTASFADNVISCSYAGAASSANSSSISISSSYAFVATSASYSPVADSASNAVSASLSVSASYGLSASYALICSTALVVTSASYAVTASVASSLLAGIPSQVSCSWASASLSSVSASYAIHADTASFALSTNDVNLSSTASMLSQSTAVTNNFPKWKTGGGLTDSSSISEYVVNSFGGPVSTVIISGSLYVPFECIQMNNGYNPFYITNASPWFNKVMALNVWDDVNPEFLLQANVSTSLIRMIPTGSVTFNNDGNVVVLHTVTASGFQGPLVGSASWASNAVTSSNAVLATLASTASYVATASTALSSSFANSAPLYLLKSGDNVTGILALQTAASIDATNSSNGLRFLGTGTVPDFIFKSVNTGVIALIPATGSSIYFSGSHISASFDGTASNAVSSSYCSFSSTAVTSSYASVAKTSSYAVNASSANSASVSTTSSYAISASVISGASGSFAYYDNSGQLHIFNGKSGVQQDTGLFANDNGGVFKFYQIQGTAFSGNAALASRGDGYLVESVTSLQDLATLAGAANYTGKKVLVSKIVSGAPSVSEAAASFSDVNTLSGSASGSIAPITTSFSVTASFANVALSASYAPGNPSISSSYALSSSYGLSGSYSLSASYGLSSSYALLSSTSSYIATSSFALDAEAVELTHNTFSTFNSLIFTTGSLTDRSASMLYDASGDLTYNPFSHTLKVTVVQGTLLGSSSYASNSKSASYSSNSSTASVANAITFVPSTASFALQSATASYVGLAVSSSFAVKAALADVATQAVQAGTAISASYAPGAPSLSSSYSSYAVSASIASTASYLVNLQLYVTSSLTVLTSSDNFVNVVGIFPTSSYMGAFVKVGVMTGSSRRVGEVYTTWNGAIITSTEVDGPDIGDTSTLLLSTDLSQSWFRLLATVVPSNVNPYQINSMVTYI